MPVRNSKLWTGEQMPRHRRHPSTLTIPGGVLPRFPEQIWQMLSFGMTALDGVRSRPVHQSLCPFDPHQRAATRNKGWDVSPPVLSSERTATPFWLLRVVLSPAWDQRILGVSLR